MLARDQRVMGACCGHSLYASHVTTYLRVTPIGILLGAFQLIFTIYDHDVLLDDGVADTSQDFFYSTYPGATEQGDRSCRNSADQ